MEQLNIDAAAEMRFFDTKQMQNLGTVAIAEHAGAPTEVQVEPVALTHIESTTPTVEKAQQNELEAQVSLADFDELYARYGGPVESIMRRCVRNQHDAEDLKQVTFLELYHTLTTGKTYPASAIYRVITRYATYNMIDFIRRQKTFEWRELRDERDDEKSQPQANERATVVSSVNNDNEEEESIDSRIMAGEVIGKLRESNPVGADLIVMRHILGILAEDAAPMLGIQPSGAKMRLSRAMKQARKLATQYMHNKPMYLGENDEDVA